MANSVQYQYTANMGMATFNTANSNLDGTGSLTSIITGGTNGTFLKSLILKTQTDTAVGMVRIYAQPSGGNKNIIHEVYVPPITKSARDLSYSILIPMNYTLGSGEVLWASTEHGDTFNAIVEGFDISFSTSTSYLGSTLEFVKHVGNGRVTTANRNLDGTGAIVQILQAGAATTYQGCAITSIMIKALQTTSPGMVRLFIADNTGMNNPVLFCEVIIPSMTQGSTTRAFEHEVIASGSICIPPSYSLYASTENTESFSIVTDAFDWKYV